jgi:hypothetical protein
MQWVRIRAIENRLRPDLQNSFLEALICLSQALLRSLR